PEEYRGVAGRRKLAPEARQPVALGGFAAIVARTVDGVMARVEGGGELSQRILLAGALGPFEDDDGTPAMRDLRQLELAPMGAQRCQHRFKIAARRRLVGGCEQYHERSLSTPA